MLELLGAPCVELLDSLHHVSVDHDRLRTLAAELIDETPLMPEWEHPAFPSEPGDALDSVVWLGNALNFCYWVADEEEMWSVEVGGKREVDAFALFGALHNALQSGVDLGDGRFLAGLTGEGPEKLFKGGEGTLPLMDRRIEILKEIGRVLMSDFDGRLENAVAAAGNNAVKHASFLADTFPSFGDQRELSGHQLPFLKRAQLAAGMLHARRVALGVQGMECSDRLTVYADYMLPRVLRHEGVMIYSPPLAEKVDAREEIEARSQEETEIRVAVVGASCLLVDIVSTEKPLDGLRLDFMLWRRGFEIDAPHHRTLTTDY